MSEVRQLEAMHPSWDNPVFTVELRQFTGRLGGWLGEIRLDGRLYEIGGEVTGLTRDHALRRAEKFVAKERKRIRAQRKFDTDVEVVEL